MQTCQWFLYPLKIPGSVLSSSLIIILVTHQVGVVWVVSAHVSLQLAEAGKALAAVAGDVGGARAEAGA